jgi:alpha-glucosidase (family GH31 glycosyl hydrolase)
VHDPAMGPAEYLMTDPFWFTERGTGLWVDTEDVMDVSMHSGVFSYTLTDSATMHDTVFVEQNAHQVYRDYIGIAGTPAKSDATRAEYATPLWNSWAQFYTSVSQASVLKWATGLHDADVPGHTIQIDDGWSTHYGDFVFNSKFPHPKQLSAQIHAMGYNLGLWVTLWINNDADNYSYAAQHGYLLKSKSDPGEPCNVTWWNGTAGIVDLANPAARSWYEGELKNLEKTYDVNGFKFDTRFFDESCAPYPGYTSLDYIKLGAQLTDEFDQQGAGVRLSWTGSQRYGFVIREVDKGTDWGSLQAAVAQTMAISTIGYPFVETDMIGGSLSDPPPSKAVLVRWAQAASLMPLMYSSTSPLGVSNSAGSQQYDAQTVALYKAAVQQHRRLASYIDDQVQRAVRTGEPIMKPLFFDFPNDTASYTVDDEWLLGDSILAAPVLSDGTSRSVHLPPGKWYDQLRHRVVQGPVTIADYHASLAQTPTFVRVGS